MGVYWRKMLRGRINVHEHVCEGPSDFYWNLSDPQLTSIHSLPYFRPRFSSDDNGGVVHHVGAHSGSYSYFECFGCNVVPVVRWFV